MTIWFEASRRHRRCVQRSSYRRLLPRLRVDASACEYCPLGTFGNDSGRRWLARFWQRLAA